MSRGNITKGTRPRKKGIWTSVQEPNATRRRGRRGDRKDTGKDVSRLRVALSPRAPVGRLLVHFTFTFDRLKHQAADQSAERPDERPVHSEFRSTRRIATNNAGFRR